MNNYDGNYIPRFEGRLKPSIMELAKKLEKEIEMNPMEFLGKEDFSGASDDNLHANER